MRDAKLQLDLARNYVREVRCDVRTGVCRLRTATTHTNTIEAEGLALAHYQDVLRLFADLVMDGKVHANGTGA